MLDDALYDAFGQRQVSTMFTQLNQYRVVLETQPASSRPDDLEEHLPALPGGRRCRSGPSPRSRRAATPLVVNHQGQFPVVTVSFNLAPGASLGAGRAAIEKARRSWACRRASRRASRGPRRRSARRSRTSVS
jgi:multidrug efflux pump